MLEADETEQLPAPVNVEASPESPTAAPVQQPQTVPEVPWGGQTFDPQHFKMDYRGQVHHPKDAAHAKALMQQGISYSQSMEEVGKKNKAMDQRETDLEGKYGKYKAFDERLLSNPQLYDQVSQLMNNPDGQVQPGNGQIVRNSHTDGEIQTLKGQIQSLTEDAEDRVLSSNIDKLKQSYPTYDWQADDGNGTLATRVMLHAQNLGLDHKQMDLAFQNYHFDQLQNQARVNGAAQVSNKVQAQTQAGIQQGAGAQAPATAPPAIDHKNLTYAQLSEGAKKELGV